MGKGFVTKIHMRQGCNLSFPSFFDFSRRRFRDGIKLFLTNTAALQQLIYLRTKNHTIPADDLIR